jgi:thioredoxin 1
MKTPFLRNWKSITVTLVLALAGGTVVYEAAPEGSLRAAWRQPPVPAAQPEGDEIMFTQSPTKQAVEHANEANFEQLVLRSNVPVLVDFYADWCGPCQALAPTLEQLARDTANVRIVKVNVDRSPTLAARYRIESIPHLMVFKKGRMTDQVVGLASKNHLKALLSR